MTVLFPKRNIEVPSTVSTRTFKKIVAICLVVAIAFFAWGVYTHYLNSDNQNLVSANVASIDEHTGVENSNSSSPPGNNIDVNSSNELAKMAGVWKAETIEDVEYPATEEEKWYLEIEDSAAYYYSAANALQSNLYDNVYPIEIQPDGEIHMIVPPTSTSQAPKDSYAVLSMLDDNTLLYEGYRRNWTLYRSDSFGNIIYPQ